ncbi:iron transporter [Halarchaeum sp. P4]|uniref:iron transporter n=1 Tax=Halarchaeum sp. P4 TaxID=3421639 RepID=UPI003EC0275A
MPSRRAFLGTLGAGGLAGLAGCSALNLTREETQSSRSSEPPLPDRPNAVYYPSHVDGMLMSGMQTRGGYACALTYTVPHRFWLTVGEETKRVSVRAEDSLHVMPVVWDAATNTVLTDLNPVVRFRADGELVTSNAPWPMLSQSMGFHFGDNVALPGDGGSYEVSVRVGAPAARRVGTLADAPESVTFDFSLAYSQSELEAVSRRFVRTAGERGAVDPTEMKMPVAQVPPAEDLSGRVLGQGTSGDATFVATVIDDATRFGGGESQTYLAVSVRTPCNRIPLPMTGLRAKMGGTTRDLTETLDADLGHHYGTVLDTAPGPLSLEVTVPSQAARHEGYETAFLSTGTVTVG